ncbi:MAG: tRNA pseudouridine(55) synthase TruB [Clostridiales bacterium]|nr:tRNA pseudouridine(55) synthase TruB [Clostridiales bacterium]
MNGVINIYKEEGLTSFDVCKEIRKISGEKKIGHTGTLDPKATGVLPICLGKATKIIDYIMNDNKSYFTEFKLGINTDTYDLEGKLIEEFDISTITEEDVEKAVLSFCKEYMQVPPMYSALKKNGVRLYDLARQGIEVEREGRRVVIYNIENIKINLPYVSMDVTCSKGTYIRSLCFDIGQKLNVGATVTKLERTRTSSFYKENSIKLSELTKENIHNYLITIEEALKKYDSIKINKGFSKLLVNGVKVCDKRVTNCNVKENILYRIYDENNIFLGLGMKDEKGLKMSKLLI